MSTGLNFGLDREVKPNSAAVSWEFPVLKEYNLVLSSVLVQSEIKFSLSDRLYLITVN